MTDDETVPTRTLALQSGTAALPDVAWAAMRAELARRLGRSVVREADGPVRGVLGVAFGVVAVAWPESSLRAMVIAFAVYCLLDGALALAGLFTPSRSWQLALQGAVGVGAGLVALARPDASRSALLYLLAVWVVVMAAMRLRTAIEFGEPVRVRWVPAALALLGIVAGATVLIDPGRGLTGVMVNIAVFPVLHGVALIADGVRRADR